MALMEKAAGQGHAFASHALGQIHKKRNEHVQTVEWYTKAAQAGLPDAMFDVGLMLDQGEGMEAPNHPAAADWYKRAAELGNGSAANNLGNMYELGRGRACQTMHASSCSRFQTLVS
jgi:TPR repeat protein